MRCKVGDLAVIIDSRRSENLGIVVRVKAPYPAAIGIHVAFGSMWDCSDDGFCWQVVSQGRPIISSATKTPHMERMYADAALRPIRDQPGQDEMIRIAGLPKESVREALIQIRELMELRRHLGSPET